MALAFCWHFKIPGKRKYLWNWTIRIVSQSVSCMFYCFIHDDDDGVSTSRLALGFELWSLLRRDQRWVLKFSSLSSKSCSSCCCCVSDRHRLNKTTIETRQTVNKYLRNSGIAANCWMPNQDICPNSKSIHRKYSSTESRYRFVKLFWHNQTLKLHF